MPISALIFDIKKYAIHDGPGIRSTFFFKSCPLSCIWCQNPESISPKQAVAFNIEKCIHCGACRQVCPSIGDDGLLLDAECIRCGQCVEVCSAGARQFIGTVFTPQSLLSEALKDKIFYDTSGGGVTLSGGECMMQIEFVETVLKMCRQNGLHTAIDTCGHVPWENFRRIIGLADLYLYDLKVLDRQRHKTYTGVGNELILSNLEKLAALDQNIIIRVPLIPQYTDSEDDIRVIADYIKSELKNRVLHVELLPYNTFAEAKYHNNTAFRGGGFGKYRPGSLQTQTTEYIRHLCETFTGRGTIWLSSC